MSSRRWIAAFGLALSGLALSHAGCTAFDDAVVPKGGGGQGGGAAGGTSSGGGGSGGSPLAPGLLTSDEAMKVCTMTYSSEWLASSIVASLGIPIGRADNAYAKVTSQSECLTWLLGPMPSNRGPSVSVEQQKALQAVAAKWPNAEAAAATLAFEYLSRDDVKCKGKTGYCDADDNIAYDCTKVAPSVALHCESSLFEPGSACVDGEVPTCARGTCTGTDVVTCTGGINEFCFKPGEPKVGYQCLYTGTKCGGSNLCANPDGTTQACTKLGDTDCNGSQLRICDGKFFLDYDCSGIVAGSVCTPDTDPSIKNRCDLQGAECTPASGGTIDSCEGGVLTACVTGRTMRLPCPDGSSCAGSACCVDSVCSAN